MKWWILLLLGVSASVNAQVPGPSLRAEFFSEGAYWSGNSSGTNSTFARAFAGWNPQFQPFLQMGSEQTFGAQGNGEIYFSPGVHWHSDYLKMYGEHRFHQRNNENLANHEWRALFVLGRTIDFPIFPQESWLMFVEPYSELLFSTNRNNYVLLQALSRFGLRYQLASQISTDFFVEPYVSYTQNQVGESGLFQVRPSLRAKTCFDSLCIAVSAARLIPTGSSPDQGFRLLATIGGMI
ncbi:MAG: hypothetical protein ACKN9V_02185 [Pseudomonadota bacterium]